MKLFQIVTNLSNFWHLDAAPAECKITPAECKITPAECKITPAECKITPAECKIKHKYLKLC